MRSTLAFLAVSALLPAAEIPRTWTAESLAGFEVPLVNPAPSATRISEAAYYAIPTRTIYKTHPVYHPSKEPAGYMDWLKAQEPQVAFRPEELKTEADWTKAGELIFNNPTSFGPVFFGANEVRNPAFYEQTGMPVAKDGTIPFARWVIRKKGQVELGSMGCNTCHTRVMVDGTVVPGAQGNNPNDRQGAWMLRQGAKFAPPAELLKRVRTFAQQFEVPGLAEANDPNRRPRTMSLDEFIAAGAAIPPGVTARSHTSMVLPPQIPDIIGVRERRFLDHTGLVRQTSIGDLMRYSTLVQDVMNYNPPNPGLRYTDEQLYALALYVYSLQPPPNPNPVDATALRGKAVFERARCGSCHTAPLYTNNKLLPAGNFTPSKADSARLNVSTRRVGTDPRYALQSRKATGYYKVPSLKGLWYRGPLEHNGSVATLEDWFNPRRLDPDYVPTGYAGPDGKTRSVPGHDFGLKLPLADRQALIAFLRTL